MIFKKSDLDKKKITQKGYFRRKPLKNDETPCIVRKRLRYAFCYMYCCTTWVEGRVRDANVSVGSP